MLHFSTYLQRHRPAIDLSSFQSVRPSVRSSARSVHWLVTSFFLFAVLFLYHLSYPLSLSFPFFLRTPKDKIKSNQWGLFYGRNGTAGDRMSIGTGINNLNDIAQVKAYKVKPISVWMQPLCMGMITSERHDGLVTQLVQ